MGGGAGGLFGGGDDVSPALRLAKGCCCRGRVRRALDAANSPAARAPGACPAYFLFAPPPHTHPRPLPAGLVNSGPRAAAAPGRVAAPRARAQQQECEARGERTGGGVAAAAAGAECLQRAVKIRRKKAKERPEIGQRSGDLSP
jgi:hypothetical protein